MILVVDDTTSNLFVMNMIFEEIKEFEIELKPALNGKLAVEVVENSQPGKSFSHIFLDLQMSIMDGY